MAQAISRMGSQVLRAITPQTTKRKMQAGAALGLTLLILGIVAGVKANQYGSISKTNALQMGVALGGLGGVTLTGAASYGIHRFVLNRALEKQRTESAENQEPAVEGEDV